jgi:aryl-alcohol dehydrogenase-like predicted oxidoreductase
MRTRRIGSLEVSVVGIGCNNFGARMDRPQVDAVVGAALDSGINFFDTAAMYGKGASERLLGEALGSRRDEVVIATKFGGDRTQDGRATREYVRESAEASLARLATDRIDLYQLHFPDLTTPVEETLGALAELIEEGKVIEVGCSNFNTSMLEEAEAAAAKAGARFVSVQNYYNLLKRDDEAEILPTCERLGISYLPYFPLANGLLTGKYRPGEDPPEGTRLAGNRDRARTLLVDENLDRVAALEKVAAREGHSLVELAIAWLLAHPPLASVIAGATKPVQVEANAAGGDWDLPDDLMREIDEITTPAS